MAANAADVKFEYVGLQETQSIARMIVHPKDPNTVWVAAVGHLFGPNPERGVFMTTDGGKTWNKTLYVDAGHRRDASSSSIRAIRRTCWAAMYERRRTAWGFVGGGPGSGIYQSTDGGKTWKKVTGNGLPRGTMGRIALDICKTQPNVIYAQIEVAPDKETGAGARPAAPAAQRARRGRQRRRRSRRRRRRGRRRRRRRWRRSGRRTRWRTSAARSADATASGARSTRARPGRSCRNENQRPMYFSQIRVDPNNPNVVYVGGVNPQKSIDGGKTFTPIQRHGPRRQPRDLDRSAQRHAGHDSKHVMYGNDGGLDVSYDAGATWESVRMWAAALLVSRVGRHAASVLGLHGPAGQRIVVRTELDAHAAASTSGTGSASAAVTASRRQIDPTDPNIFYTESQNGGINRYDLNTGETQSVKPTCRRRRRRRRRWRWRRAAAAVRRGGGGARRRAVAQPPARPPAAAVGGGGGRGNVINTPPADAIVAVQLEHADPALAAQPEHAARRRHVSSSSRAIAARRG